LEVFDCTIVVGDMTYLNASPGLQCGTPTHKIFLVLAYVMLFAYCIGLPLFVMGMLWKYRISENHHIQNVLRFFYDGFKPKRYYWEIIILLRKFLLVVALILGRANGNLDQIYGFLWIVQTALLVHITFHPYISGRQFRLELWSLMVILVTLCVSLYIPTLGNSHGDQVTAYFLSTFVMVINVVVILGFIFFITRGLMRKFTKAAWSKVASFWNKLVPNRIKKEPPQLNSTMNFFQMVSNSSEYDRELLYATLEKWWKTAPNYKRRRLMAVLLTLSKGTPFENFPERRTEDNRHLSIESVDSYADLPVVN